MGRIHILVGALGVLTLGAALFLLAPSVWGQQTPSVERDTQGPVAGAEHGTRMAMIASRGSRIGVSIRDLAQADLATHKLPSLQGVVVEAVRETSPAEKAGVKSGDVVVEFDGERIRSARQLGRLVQETPSGREVPLVVMRSGQRIDLKVSPVEERGMAMWQGDDGPPMMLPGMEGMETFNFRLPDIDIPHFDFEILMGSRLGVTVSELSGQLAEYFGVKEGALVSEVTAGSPAAAAGIKAGDVITSIGGNAVDSPRDVRRHLRDLSTAEVSVGIVRDRKAQTLTVKVERDEREGRPRPGGVRL